MSEQMTVADTTREAGLSGTTARQAALEAGLTQTQAELFLPGEGVPQAGQADLVAKAVALAVAWDDALDLTAADTMKPRQWLAFHRATGKPELAARVACASRLCLTKMKRAERLAYFIEVRQERLASLPSDCHRRWLQQKAACDQLKSAGDVAGLAKARSDWNAFCADLAWGGWKKGCLAGCYRQAWVLLHKA